MFSRGQFGSVLDARWIGLPLVEAQHFALGTASLSILGCDPPHHSEVPSIALWNAASHEPLDSGALPRAGDKQTMKQQAIERWENEGGEIPGEQPVRIKLWRQASGRFLSASQPGGLTGESRQAAVGAGKRTFRDTE